MDRFARKELIEKYIRVVSDDKPKIEANVVDMTLLQEFVRTAIWSFQEKCGVINLFKWRDISSSKQAFYSCGRLDLYSLLKYSRDGFLNFDLGNYHLLYAILSDNAALINRYAHIGDDINVPSREKGSVFHAMQCLIKEDYNALRERLMLIEKYHTSKQLKHWAPYHIRYFQAMMDRDKDTVQQVIRELESPKNISRIKRYYENHAEFMSFPGMAYAKLAWMKGLEVKVDSAYIIQELLPVLPNENYYDDYDFLKELDEIQEPMAPVSLMPSEEVGPYPDRNPTLRSVFVSAETIRNVVDNFCRNHPDEEKLRLTHFIWEAYTDPEHFDLKYSTYVKTHFKNIYTRDDGEKVIELRPFWSELTEYDDEGFFIFCIHFIIMEEMGLSPDIVDNYLFKLKSDLG